MGAFGHVSIKQIVPVAMGIPIGYILLQMNVVNVCVYQTILFYMNIGVLKP